MSENGRNWVGKGWKRSELVGIGRDKIGELFFIIRTPPCGKVLWIHVRPSVRMCVRSCVRPKRTFSRSWLVRFFLIVCMKLGVHKGSKLTEMVISGKKAQNRSKIYFFIWNLAHYFFLISCMELEVHKGSKLKKAGVFLSTFCPNLGSI